MIQLAKASKALAAAEKEQSGLQRKLEATTPLVSGAKAKMKSVQKRMAELRKGKANVMK